MKKLFLLLSALVLCSFTAPEGPNITGLWKTRDQKSDTPRSLVVIYEYQNKYYGRMLATYGKNGEIQDSILAPTEKAPGIIGNPPYCGMDFIYNVEKKTGKKYKGKIVDPEEGKVYDAKFWRDGNILVLRGELWIFGKNIPWQPAFEKDLPEGFSMEEVKKFVPVIPKVN